MLTLEVVDIFGCRGVVQYRFEAGKLSLKSDNGRWRIYPGLHGKRVTSDWREVRTALIKQAKSSEYLTLVKVDNKVEYE
jgi:hypothetical protein